MAMEVAEDRSSSEGGDGELFLPFHLWERILSHLPISTLAIASCASRAFLSILRSRTFLSLYRSLPPHPNQDLLLLLFSSPSLSPSPYAASYHPFLHRWLSLPLHCGILASAGPHLLLHPPLVLSSFPFLLPPFPLHPVPPSFFVLSLLRRPVDSYAILAVSTSDRIRSQLYDPNAGLWSPAGDLPIRVSVIGSAAEVDGSVYCLTRGPDALLRFDPARKKWEAVVVDVPSLACSHVAGWGGRLWLLGGVEELGDIVGVGVWEMEWGERGGWREVGRMPEGLLRRFGGVGMSGFEVVDRRGVVCFCNTARRRLVLCDLRVMRWWRPPPCPFRIAGGKEGWLGHAVEPQVELLLPQDQR